MSEHESPDSQEYRNVTVRMTAEKAEELSNEAEQRGVSRAQFLRGLIDGRDALLNSGDESTDSDRESDGSAEERKELREKLEDAKERMHEEEKQRIRYEERIERITDTRDAAIEEKKQLAEEKDKWQNRYHESQGKLKVHNSEKSLPARLKSWFTRE
jgi:chromosome segregation ATPase